MQYLPHYDRNTGIPKGSYPTADDVMARSKMIRESGLNCVGEMWDPGNGNVPVYEGPTLDAVAMQIMCLKPLVEKNETEELVNLYKKEYERVNGKVPHVVISGAWVTINDDPYRKADVQRFTETLKDRPNY